MAKISDLLKEKGIYSKEIKMMLQRGSVLINGNVVKEDLELGNVTFKMDWGDFCFDINRNKKEFLPSIPPVQIMEYVLGRDMWKFADVGENKPYHAFWNQYAVLRFKKHPSEGAMVINNPSYHSD